MSVVQPPVELHDDDPLDAAAPAYPEPEVVEPAVATPTPVRSAVSGAGADPVPAADPVTPGQAAAAGTSRAPFPRLPSMPSLPAQPVRSGPIAAEAPAVVRTTVPVQPRDAAAAGLPPVPTGTEPWTARPSTPRSTAPAGARAPSDREYVAFPIEEDQPR